MLQNPIARIALASLLTATLTIAPACAANAPFALFDNMFYRGKPDTAKDGFVASNILYESVIWPHKVNYGVLPDQGEFDIEELPLHGSADVVSQHLHVLSTLADWAHAAAPGKVIGYYGSNTLTRVAPEDLEYARELAKHVDAFFPPAYTFDDDRNKWQQRTQDAAAEARAFEQSKPFYFYMWPQNHYKTPKQFQFVDAAYWTFQLQTVSHVGNGIVLWSPSKFDWSDSTGWWAATQQFARDLKRNPYAGFVGI